MEGQKTAMLASPSETPCSTVCFPVPRPVVDKEIIKAAALRTAQTASNIAEGYVRELADSITEHYRQYMDGFELAKELDQEGWEVNTIFVEDMDEMYNNVRNLHREACIRWAEENSIEPPFPAGTEIKEGIITGVYTYDPACFRVKPVGQDDEKDNHRRIIIRFEDAVPVGQ